MAASLNQAAQDLRSMSSFPALSSGIHSGGRVSTESEVNLKLNNEIQERVFRIWNRTKDVYRYQDGSS
jgi:hypothetical protein